MPTLIRTQPKPKSLYRQNESRALPPGLPFRGLPRHVPGGTVRRLFQGTARFVAFSISTSISSFVSFALFFSPFDSYIPDQLTESPA